ncbi:general transcription factor IIH subunit 1 [Brachionus plicatilis]|uniref:General transcription factor IIH subunit 1 n=1 Tax=Brachionus plicatilis TaxID=10195 RepID=A0A3M7S8Y4_BRAPC|nr:general transcription factor IIH subunit 1 [Brachionus plicatilis]
MSGNSKEEIIHQIENVRCKKLDGILYVMSERISWISKGREKTATSISHNYVDIKTQKISSEGKAKVQLQVVLHDDSSTTFHFTNPGGQEAQLKDRDKVKEELSQLLPKFGQKISAELEKKKKILIENPHIYQLYNDLVVSQILSAEDFWKNFVNIEDYKSTSKSQKTGVAQGFMANICPKSDGTNGLVYNLSYDDKESILKTYPAVKIKYNQNVPSRMSEQDFWTKFFQSFYFRKDQINLAADDIFKDCALKLDEELKSRAEQILTEPVDIIDSQKVLSSDDGFGLTDFSTSKASNLSNQNLIKRYNYYSMRVLKSMEENTVKEDNKVTKNSGGSNKIRLLDDEIKDLEKEEFGTLKGAALNLKHIDRYFYAPKPIEKESLIGKLLKNKDTKNLCQTALEELQDWSLDIKKVSNPSLAISILVDLSPGSQLMQTNNVQNLRDEVPKNYQEEIKSIYVSSCEMLKTYHAMFPPKNSEQELKLKLARDTLKAFYQQKIMALRDQLVKESFSWNVR